MIVPPFSITVPRRQGIGLAPVPKCKPELEGETRQEIPDFNPSGGWNSAFQFLGDVVSQWASDILVANPLGGSVAYQHAGVPNVLRRLDQPLDG